MAQNVDTIKTERLLLRGIDESDADTIIEWRSDPEVFRYFKSPHKISRDEHLKWFKNGYLANENRHDWTCIEQATDNRIGVFGLIRDKDTVEVNYILAPEAQHKGYASESIMALMEYARMKWGSERMTAEIHRDNKASIDLVRRLRFTNESEDGEFYIYSMEL